MVHVIYSIVSGQNGYTIVLICFSFPGGMKDEGDTDLVFTALRETHEEIGLNADKVNIWGSFPPIPTNTVVHIKPFS